MRGHEWLRIVADEIDTRWPRHELPDDSTALYLRELGDFEADQVRVAVIAIDRGGDQRFTPPTAGQIRAKVVDLATDAPTWAHVRRRVRALYAYSPQRWRSGEVVDERAERVALEDPMVARFVDLVGWEELSLLGAPDDRTLEAQLRTKYEALVAGDKGDMALAGLPSAGLKRLERVNRGPRQIGGAITALLDAGKGIR